MGIFSFSNKEGPGIYKDRPQKKRFFLFWEILGRKIGKLIQLNLLFSLFAIPLAVVIFLGFKSLYFLILLVVEHVQIMARGERAQPALADVPHIAAHIGAAGLGGGGERGDRVTLAAMTG